MKKSVLMICCLVFLAACSGVEAAAPAPAPATEGGELAASRTVSAEGVLRPSPSAELAFAQSGLIAEVLVQPGDGVASGDVLARLRGIETVRAEERAALLELTLAAQALADMERTALLAAAQAERALLDAQKRYETAARNWRIGNRDQAGELDLAIEDYVEAEKEYREALDALRPLLGKDQSHSERRRAQADVERERANLARAYADVTRAAAEHGLPLTQAQADLIAAAAVLEEAREQQSRLDEENIDPELRDAAEARAEAANAHVLAAQEALALFEIRAPFAGIVESNSLKVGEIAVAGMPVIYLGDTSRWIVEIKDLPEIDIARIAVGQEASIVLDAFPGEEFNGRVIAIDPVGKLYRGDMTYTVTIELDDADERFYWNMTATVSIEVEE